METRLKVSPRQILALQLLNDQQIVDLLFGGGAGGGKTLLVCIWMVLQCRDYPGIRIGLGRKEMTKLKQTTLVSLLREAHPILGVKQGEFVYRDQKNLIEYANGSQIQFVDLAKQPSDPNFDSLGSLNLTHCVIEEVGEVNQKARDVFFSRKNRFLNKEYNLVGKSISTCNPSPNYIKKDYYLPYKQLGGGDYQKWEYGKVEVGGERRDAYRAFVRSLVTDNPFISANYIEVLRRLPGPEKKRLLEGNWDFEDTDKMLFRPEVIDRSLIGELPTGTLYLGVDVADVGKDRTVITAINGDVIVDQQEVRINPDQPVGDQIALEVIKYAQLRGMNSGDAQRIGIDTNGVGASTRDFMRHKGWHIKEFIAGGGSPLGFKNLRNEALWGMSQAMEKGELKVYNRLPTLEKLREQLMAHEFDTEERTVLVKSKKHIKEDLGESPDHAESAYIAYWTSRGDTDPRNNPNRVQF